MDPFTLNRCGLFSPLRINQVNLDIESESPSIFSPRFRSLGARGGKPPEAKGRIQLVLSLLLLKPTHNSISVQ